jgi:pimeloyl-ACP methyl ester carboxylesterase
VLTHRVDGEGPPLVLLNGGLMTIGSWEPLVVPLKARYRVIRCDFRGQLLTPGPFANSLEEHAADVIELLDFLEIDRAHLAGVSFGAEVAMTAAARYPDRVARLTIITATDYTTEAMRQDAREGRALATRAAAGEADGGDLVRHVAAATWSDWWLAKQPPQMAELRAHQVAALPRTFFEGAAAILGTLEDLDLRPHLSKIKAPTLVIGGENDRVFPPDHSRAIAAAIPNARLEILAGTGHGLLIERADRVLELLLS